MSIEGQNAKDIFLVAIEKSDPENRSAYLDEACGRDGPLRQRVEALLEGHQGKDAFLDVEPTVDQTSHEQPGTVIDNYRLMEQIGEGGMGVVYVAEQQQPIRRRVALKVIKPGMDSKEIVSRFAAERQALALMDHPNIAKVYDAGTTASGRPYFIMELVRGIPITEYCNLNRFSAHDRLALFVNVCEAVQHAHQKGVIHRDLKPSNVLVTEHDGKPVVKVIDFGVAKAINQNLTEWTIYTRHQQMVGTPLYMSPEQAALSGLDVDTRSDIYSLGVLLYELLTGTTPFDKERLREAAFDEVRRIIREEEPSKPSTKVRTLENTKESLTGYRGGDRLRLSQVLCGDMDWIVMKALEKDRNRRYDTAKGLANDIERHLNNQTISARPPSAAYHFQKFVRRHRTLLTSAVLISIALIVGSGIAVWMAVAANRARLEAQANLVRAREAEAQHRGAAKAAERLARQEAEARADTQRALAAMAVQEAAARRHAYISDINLAQRALEQSNIGRARRLLLAHVPPAGQREMRGWEWRYLWQQCRSQTEFDVHEPVNRFCWSVGVTADGRWLACIHQGPDPKEEYTLSIHDLVDHSRSRQMPAGTGTLAVSSEEPLIAFVSSEDPRTVELRDLDAQRRIRSLQLDFPVKYLKFSGDGEYLVVVESNRISLWRTRDGSMSESVSRVIRISEGDPFAVSHDGELVAFGEGDRLCVYSWCAQRVLWTKPFGESILTAAAFSHDATILASGTGYAETEVHLWNAETGERLARLAGHQSWVSGLCFWPDGGKLASASADQTIRIWDIQHLEEARCLARLLGHASEVWSVAVLPDQGRVYSGAKDGEVSAWRLNRVQETQFPKTIDREVSNWAFTSDGRAITTIDRNGNVDQWSLPDLAMIRRRFTVPTSGTLHTVGPGVLPGSCFSPDGRLLAAPTSKGVVTVWDIAEGRVLCELPETPAAYVVHFMGNERLILRYADLTLHQWNLVSLREEELPDMPRIRRGVWTMTPDESLQFIIGYRDGSGQVRNVKTGVSDPFLLETTRLVDATLTKDNRWIATASQSSGIATLWDLKSRRPIGRFRDHLNAVHSVAFSPDESRLATGGGGAEAVKVWDVESRRELLNLDGEGALMSQTGFSPDGSTLATVTSTGKMHVWHAPSWSQIGSLESETSSRESRGLTVPQDVRPD